MKSYISLFKHCHKLLLNIRKLYVNKLQIDLEKWQCYELLNNKFYKWFADANADLDASLEEYNLDNFFPHDLKMAFLASTLEAYKYKYFADIIENEKDPVELVRKVFNK